MKIEILNPEVVQNLYQNHGVFACECYDTPAKFADRVGKNCQQNGHMSGSRCEYIKFRISDVDRGTAEQCLRHEIGTDVPFFQQDNYNFSDYSDLVLKVNPADIVKNMASFRYIDKSGFKYAIPATIRKSKKALALYKELMKNINITRSKIKTALVEDGVKPQTATQDANFVLPRATTTSFVIGFTPEALIHFCHKRLCTRAQEFIREIAKGMKKAIKEISPEFASELVPQCQHLLWCPEGKNSCHLTMTKEEASKILSIRPKVFKNQIE